MVMLDTKKSLLVVVLAAIGASVCCVGPLVLLMVGISGAWIGNLTAFEPYRPFFVGVTVIFIGLAYRRLYLVPQVCTPGATCSAPMVLKRQRMFFWIVSALTLGLLAVPLLAPFFF